jgi:NAD(P)-dependent dehydrogenase (short-subunit alcohol dehydrogenase family)
MYDLEGQIDKFGAPDIVLNNAGAGRWLSVAESAPADAIELMAVPYWLEPCSRRFRANVSEHAWETACLYSRQIRGGHVILKCYGPPLAKTFCRKRTERGSSIVL